MGFYINPKDSTKEDWLNANGRRIPASNAMETIKGGTEMPVCLIDNFAFQAAAIGFSEGEVHYFLNDNSGRPKQWWAVPNEKIYEAEPALAPGV